MFLMCQLTEQFVFVHHLCVRQLIYENNLTTIPTNFNLVDRGEAFQTSVLPSTCLVEDGILSSLSFSSFSLKNNTAIKQYTCGSISTTTYLVLKGKDEVLVVLLLSAVSSLKLKTWFHPPCLLCWPLPYNPGQRRYTQRKYSSLAITAEHVNIVKFMWWITNWRT